ncbi:hypothetical protein EF888_16195 [Silicimonas algicola]|uniref:Secretory lipase n=1 Tax=Silicimonas algicola TaxID=1826607 RepID=A0A316G4Y3_9RHOB|nr:lipase family protein [Silicimonas algicola]AZQ68537.1 hypothetical protein EF888_16195 [Silicimonas algicola]PWK55753.1 secretory lipase [Silicimonas algicola]
MRRWLGGVAAALTVLIVTVWIVALPSRPDGFYRAGDGEPGPPGRLIAAEAFTRGVPEGARGWRILYTTTRGDGSPAVASAVIVAPEGAEGQVPVVAYAHGTTGVAAGCAPSMFDNPFPNVPGFPALLDEGWAYVATDYVGLGTGGGHRYLDGPDAARAVLDSVRAARTLAEAPLGGPVAVWGHSQGGHSALWTAQIVRDYAPDLDLAGVAAISPASDLPALLAAAGHSIFGTIIQAYLVAGYDRAYPDIDAWGHVDWRVQPLVRDMARRCIEFPDIWMSIAEAGLIPERGVFARLPGEGAFGDRLRMNVPRGPFPVPLLVGHGGRDDLVLPEVQDGYVASLCAAGEAVDYRTYPEEDHVSVVQPVSPLTAELIGWTRARFAGEAFSGTCPPP